MAKRVELALGEQRRRVSVEGDRVTVERRRGEPDAPLREFVVRSDSDGGLVAKGDGRRFQGAAIRVGDAVWVSVDGRVFVFTVASGHAARRARAGAADEGLTPPMPATVLRVSVAPGDHVGDGDVLVVLEAMKMELAIRAPRDGIVRAVHCHEGEIVQPGTMLVELEDHQA